MSKKKSQPSLNPLEDPELLRFIREHAQEGFVASGAIPKGHKGPYTPSRKEWLEGARLALEAKTRTSQTLSNTLSELISELFKQEEEQK